MKQNSKNNKIKNNNKFKFIRIKHFYSSKYTLKIRKRQSVV